MSFLLHYDPILLVKTAGYAGLFAIIFAESGLFFGFFLPGDSLLFAAGLLASGGFFNIISLAVTLSVGAILGDSVGYWFGAKVGPTIFSREDSFLFHKKHIGQTERFYAKYGPRAVVLARFVPIVRTFAPILAGVGKMNYGRFLRYNILGGILWAAGITSIGYFLGESVPNSEKYLTPIIIVIIIVSFLPILFELIKSRGVS